MHSNLIGRFAPSPTGDLHFGSLLAALASYCDIKKRDGLWRVRIDDIDGPRSVPGSASAILKSLEFYGFEWDDDILWQSLRLEHYAEALATLVREGLIFSCNCSRRSLPANTIYPGKCRTSKVHFDPLQSDYRLDDHALRCRMLGEVHIDDTVQGAQQINLQTDIGDTIVWRRDGLVSYSLACAIDDAETSSHVVRGADLLDSTAAQAGIMQALGLSIPHYAHIPIAVDSNGDKLSKHSKAQAIIDQKPLPTLLQAWHFLGQTSFEPASLNEFWQHAPTLWQMHNVPSNSRLSL